MNTGNRYYLAGPMSTEPDNGFAAFDQYAAQWREWYPKATFISPAEIDRVLGFTEEQEGDTDTYLSWDIPIIHTCVGIICLPGWNKSKGFLVEAQEGLRLGLVFWDADYRCLDITYEVAQWVGQQTQGDHTDYILPSVLQDLTSAIRTFESGATRNIDEGKIDPEAYLSPAVVNRYCQYMLAKATQADGSIRPGDNWQKGIPLDSYMKSMWRHFLSVWENHRTPWSVKHEQDDLCALLFNVMGYLHEVLQLTDEDTAEVSYDREIPCLASELTGDWETHHG